MCQIIEAVGAYKLVVDPIPFRMLLRSITGQQLSVAAARTIWARFLTVNRSRRVSPASVARISDDELRSAGISRAKIQSLRAIQHSFACRTVTVAKLRRLSDDDVRSSLVKLRGVGPWTADMFLMFGLGRLDIFPVGDLGIANAIGQFYGTGPKANKTFMLKVAEPWKPYRTIASWYCWQGLDLLRCGDLAINNRSN